MKLYFALLILLTSFSTSILYSQETQPDSFCYVQGDPLSYDLTANDILSGPIFLKDAPPCFRLDENFNLTYTGIGDCPCDRTYQFSYSYQNNPQIIEFVTIVMKCPVEKPECFIVDLSQVERTTVGCPLYACEDQSSIYYVPYTVGATYTWTISGSVSETYNTNQNEVSVHWGPPGTGNISVTIDYGGSTETISYCVTILEGPIADFSVDNACVCNGGTFSFMNNSLGATSYLWDFGDGNTSTSVSPNHEYSAPGLYTVTLYAFLANVSPLDGDPLCCCTDTFQLDVEVLDLPSPPIYWVSTLCEGDKSYYWTDDTTCSHYDWEVYDHTGNQILFSGDGTDSICVTWGSGPFGTITLLADSCSTNYCTKPTSVIIPIISSISDIIGEVEPCAFQTYTYTLPKWPSVSYDWTVTGGTTISQTGNVATIQWHGPGAGTIHVDYQSDFLDGLPNHMDGDCHGTADLNVTIKPTFTLNGPTTVCVGDMATYTTSAAPSSNYIWSVTPVTPYIDLGTNTLDVTFSSGPGTYVVQAVNIDDAYCQDTMRMVVNVIETPKPDSIVGKQEICPGETVTYLGYTSTPGTTLEWTVVGGTPTSQTGSPITVAWNTTGPYAISLAQKSLSSPNCLSDTIQLQLTTKEINDTLFFAISDVCINSSQVIAGGPVQHPDAEIEWIITPSTAGSVVSGQGTLSPEIEWNNDPVATQLELCVTLCGITTCHSQSFMLASPQIPEIMQIGDLCPGVSATLDATSGFVSYSWTGPVVSSSEDIVITSPGTYTLSTIDANNCSATVTYEVYNIEGPIADISSPNARTLCLPAAGEVVTLIAQTNPNYIFEWFCNGMSVQGPNTTATYEHLGDNMAGTFNYYVKVTDISTGCISTSDILTVIHAECPTGDCIPENYMFNISGTTTVPACNKATFNSSTSPNVIITGWNFDDPMNNTNDGSLSMAMHTYNEAGCYFVVASGTVPSQADPTIRCNVRATTSICIPVAARFTYEDSCLSVCFQNYSTHLPGNPITSYEWDFGDGNTSTDTDPCHEYAGSGTYTVTLTVKDGNNCEVTFQETLMLDPFGSVSANINPNPACVGDEVVFEGVGAGIVEWLWEFGDGASNANQVVSHAYLTAGVYDVTLTASNSNGCDTSIIAPVTIYPNPLDDTISYTDLVICDGEMTILTAPPGPYTYLWSDGTTTSPNLIVTAAGEYSVMYADANGCMNETEPVTVVVVPLPIAEITGPEFICDDECITLHVAQGYAYEWYENGNPLMINDHKIDICPPGPFPKTYTVDVYDPVSNCLVTSAPFTVQQAASPVFSISVIGDTCAGSPNILSIPPLADVRYIWSTGDEGLSITVNAAGLYSVIGIDTTTNCSSTESVTIYPLPDLCIVPTGCYKVCDPDTICGPEDLTSYQWNMDGVPIPGETNQCLIVTENGSYSLTGKNEHGCELTSDTLILMVQNCSDCENQDVSYKSSATSDCCYRLSYENTIDNAYELVMTTSDADITPDLGTLDPALGIGAIGPNFLTIVNSTAGDPLPSGSLFDYLQFCFTNVVNNPQTMIFHWYDDENTILCSDTLVFHCPAGDADCIYLSSDTIYCEDDQVFYEFTLCNSALNTWNVGYFDINATTPPGIMVTPPSFDLTGSEITPGNCANFTVTLSGTDISNEEFCFNIVAHSADPNEFPDALCCSLDSLHCIQIPGCSGCDKVYAEVTPSDTCCYDITLVNNYGPESFNRIDLCVLSPSTTMTINNLPGSDWMTLSYDPTNISLGYDGTVPHIPVGATDLPEICIKTGAAPMQQIEVKWMLDDQVICRDTIEVYCEPDCGYIFDEKIVCENGQWYYSGYIKNTSGVTVNEAQIVFSNPALSGFNQTINVGSLPDQGVYGPFTIVLTPPAVANEKITFSVIFHQILQNETSQYCCSFEHCIELPPCDDPRDCICDTKFKIEVAQGFSCVMSPDFFGTFQPLGNLRSCDRVYWNWGHNTAPTLTYGTESATHQFPGPGEYEVCIKVIRTDVINMVECVYEHCKEVEVAESAPSLFPNPTSGSFTVEWSMLKDAESTIEVYASNGELAHRWTQSGAGNEIHKEIDLQDAVPGIYFVVITSQDKQYIKRIIVF